MLKKGRVLICLLPLLFVICAAIAVSIPLIRAAVERRKNIERSMTAVDGAGPTYEIGPRQHP